MLILYGKYCLFIFIREQFIVRKDGPLLDLVLLLGHHCFTLLLPVTNVNN